MPFKKPDDSGYPKCPDSVFADVPANAPLLKVYDYGPLGARFFCAVCTSSERLIDPLRGQVARQIGSILAVMATSSSEDSMPILACLLTSPPSRVIRTTRPDTGSLSG